MKKKLFFTFACAMALMAGFVSCTNDDFEEFAPVAEMQKSAMTRSASGMTKEEVQARLDELSEKYGINVKMLYVRDYSEFTESTFEEIEQSVITFKNREVNTDAITAHSTENTLMDDSVIDEYEIATLSTNAEPSVEQNPEPGFILNFGVDYKVPSQYSGDLVINTQTDRYFYKCTASIKHLVMSENYFIESSMEDLSADVNEFGQKPKSTCQVGALRHYNLSCNGPEEYSFDFEFDILASYIKYNYVPNTKITTLGIVNGSYYNGLQYVWAMAHGSEMIINLPDLNE